VAVAVAMAAPVALFSAAPAFAGAASAGQTQNQPTYAELVKAADDAKKAYDLAVVAEAEGREKVEATLKALDSDTHPLKAAVLDADKAAKEAASAKAAAEKAVAEAEDKLEAARTDAEKAEAQRVLDTAKGDLAQAVTAQQAADAAAQKAHTALDDARVAAVREYSLLQQALDKAEAAKEAADKALAAAKECVRETGLTSLATGLPSKVAAGTTVDFTLKVTNGTTRSLTVDPLVSFHVAGEGAGAKSVLGVEWSDGTGWHALSGQGAEHIAHVDVMEPGEHSEVKLRMKVGSTATAADALALFASDASDPYRPCVLGPMKRYDFEVVPAGSTTGPGGAAEPGQPEDEDDTRPGTATPGQGSGPSPQGGAPRQVTPAAAAVSDGTGSLAATGSSSATVPVALAGAGAVVLGAAAVAAARRRASGSASTSAR
jgi:colicin import membrane protein